ncbi:MAG TPA: CaiB/BaiF CoA-transferase family protein [Acidimicrobiales bacterium]|nr:CaiB/BaiF CoA-transferase family protein [Acidimicrobiales bacterium]
MSGPLAGVRVVEIAGLGPAPFAGMVLADLGAEVVRVDRPSAASGGFGRADVLGRGRRSVAVDLKHPDGSEVVLRLAATADALIEGFRPGVAERLGIGPDACLARNPRLVYGLMTGWGQDGPYAAEAGHDITYAAVAGALAHIGRAGQPPTPPLNLVADFGGGGMLLALGVVSAVLSAQRTGEGQVVDAAMVDGVALLMAPFFMALRTGYFTEERGTNLLDSGAPFYDCYACADGRYVAVGALEPQFYAALVAGLGLDPAELGEQHDRAGWPAMRARFGAVFATRTRDEWVTHFAGRDACVAPVNTTDETFGDPHMQARGTVVEPDGVAQPAPAPRFSGTPAAVDRPPPEPGEHTDDVLAELGYDRAAVETLRRAGAIQ